MTVMEQRLELDVHSPQETELRVERTDISFEDLSSGCVRISVRIHNEGGERSSPTFMRLESAPLGAFVPWRPLAILSVPAMEPGESRELSVDVRRPRLAALGDFDRVPPSRLLTAVSSPDETPQPSVGPEAMTNLIRQQQANPDASTSTRIAALIIGSLAPDLWQLVGRDQPLWAGNFNVFVGANPVERHMAKALRVYPGRCNLAKFMVGNPWKSDAYAFDIVGLTPDWKATLYDVTKKRTFLVGSSDTSIRETQWVEAPVGLMVVLATHPPACCAEGNIEIHVTRRSCGNTVVVEFNLDPTAQGAGCYLM